MYASVWKSMISSVVYRWWTSSSQAQKVTFGTTRGRHGTPVLNWTLTRLREARISGRATEKECPHETAKDAGMKGTIEVYTDNAGFFRFRIKGGNGDVIVTSEAYGGKDEALTNLESVKNGAASTPVVDLTAS